MLLTTDQQTEPIHASSVQPRMHLQVTSEISLSPLRRSDQQAVIQCLGSNREIADAMIGIPFPYGPDEFVVTMEMVKQMESEFGHPLHFAIRDADQILIGVLSFGDLVPGHAAEIGYWLGKPFWGRGIMSAVVYTACNIAVESGIWSGFQPWSSTGISLHRKSFEKTDLSARE